MKHFRPLAVMLMSAILAAGTAAAADGKFGADRHAAMGLTCEACHGPDKANPATPDTYSQFLLMIEESLAGSHYQIIYLRVDNHGEGTIALHTAISFYLLQAGMNLQ